MTGFACKALRADQDRIEVWSTVPDSFLAVVEGVYRVERPPVPGDRRRPSPCPVPELLARAAIAKGMPVQRVGDLFGGAA